MVITSIKFLEFCIASVVLFLLFPRKYRWFSLLISSVAFYWISAKAMIGFIIFSTLSIYVAGRILASIDEKTAEKLNGPEVTKEDKKAIKKAVAKKRKAILLVALIINVGLLVGFKALNYFTGAFTMLAGLFVGKESADAMKLIMPLGISYFVFSAVGYLLDVYWKRYTCEKNYFRFFTFAIYYPHILQGPISRYSLLGMELKKPELRLRWNNFVVGMESILLGCFKKLVIADRLSIFVGNTLMVGDLGGMVYLTAMVCDALQIYTDFSGYMDIVSGVSKMFDVELEQNFDHPFLSKSVPEFWRRWHMSLGNWFKDYVYFPVTMSRAVKGINKKTRGLKSTKLKNLASVFLPILITWVLTGLWHGTGSGYLAWGFYYGILIMISVTFSDDIAKLMQKLKINTECFSYRVLQTIKIFCIFMGGRSLASGMSMAHRGEIFGNIFSNKFWDFSLYDFGLSKTDFNIILFALLILIAIAIIEIKENIFEWFNKQNKIFCAVVLWIMFFMVFLLGIYGTGYDTGNFMYQQF